MRNPMTNLITRGRLLALATTAAFAALGAAPAGAQQLVDAGGENGSGGLAFVLMTIMVVSIGASLFYMDRVRRRATDGDDSSVN
jgi:hypothetical protein